MSFRATQTGVSPVLRAAVGGFTLVELLVVITIIGILVSMLLPAVQAARESSRRTTCQNNLKQLGLGILQQESSTRALPSGGWGYSWAGDADLGVGPGQPGGWFFTVLPFIDQQALHDTGAGLTSGSAAKNLATNTVLQTPLPVLHCPSRRIAKIRPAVNGNCNDCTPSAGWLVAKTDYAGNGGDNNLTDSTWSRQPGSFAQEQSANYWANMAQNSGVCLQHAALDVGSIRDGLSNTYLLGEKYLQPELYETGTDAGDNENAYSGTNYDNVRTAANQSGPTTAATVFAFQPPMHDTSGYNNVWNFGSAHLAAFSMAFCDGSVRAINYAIDTETHRRLCNRADLQPVDLSRL